MPLNASAFFAATRELLVRLPLKSVIGIVYEDTCNFFEQTATGRQKATALNLRISTNRQNSSADRHFAPKQWPCLEKRVEVRDE
jgi:hypothetical protein